MNEPMTATELQERYKAFGEQARSAQSALLQPIFEGIIARLKEKGLIKDE